MLCYVYMCCIIMMLFTLTGSTNECSNYSETMRLHVYIIIKTLGRRGNNTEGTTIVEISTRWRTANAVEDSLS